MKKTLIALAAASALAAPIRARTRDVAFQFRMGSGFPGDVNRTHPASIVPGLQNVTNPVQNHGDPVLIDSATNSYRRFLTTDTAVTKIKGVLVRPYPTQQTSGGMTSAFGASGAPATGVVDVLEDGFIIVACRNFAVNNASKGGAVYVRIAATAGALIQNGFHAAADSTNTVLISNAEWNGPAGPDGFAEIRVWK